MRRLLAICLLATCFAAVPATAQDVSLGTCAGVKNVSVGSGGVTAGPAWVNPAGCLGPK